MEWCLALWLSEVACRKRSAMKKMMIAVAVMVFASATAAAQFTGKLVYQVVRPNEILTMTYYQNGNNVHVEAYTMHVNKGVIDSPTLRPQDTILFDLSKSTETHLQHSTQNAIIAPYSMTIIDQTSYGKTLSPPYVQLVGPDTANSYTCMHYAVNYNAKPFGASRRDVWVTSTLGNPGIYVMGSYLYFTPGSQQVQALTAAGFSGVVVRMKMTGQGPTTVMNLVGVDTKTPKASLFQVPSNYTIIDHSGYVPSQLGVKAPPANKALTPKQ